MAKAQHPFGSWPSPISAELVATQSRRIATVQAADGAIYFTQSRPEEKGRQVIMRARNGGLEELLPRPFSARSRVHEYGGGEFLVAEDKIYFVNDSDQQIYCLAKAVVLPISNAPGVRFADLALDAARGRLICVAEIHRPGKGRPRNRLVAVCLAEGRLRELAAGRDFYASPRLSGDGGMLAFLCWDLPDMPWDGAELFSARFAEDGALARPRRIAGGKGSAAFQPEWKERDLYYVADASGWGALYRWRNGASVRVAGARGLDLMRPQWTFATRSYALSADGRLACAYLKRGMPQLDVHRLKDLPRRAGGATLNSRISRIDDPVATGTGFAALVSQSCAAPAVMRISKRGAAELTPPAPEKIARRFLSRAEARQFSSAGRPVHGFLYPPTNLDYRGPRGALPPALIFVHGGPTAMTDRSLKMRIQYFTSRGFVVFDVNYSGSTGFGRAYRQRLDGAWGIADVADCVAAARHLVNTGVADAKRIAISGGSAGGYTTLMALATSDVFAAGSSHYGICDLRLLLAHTHKFEAGYLHRLIGTTAHRWREAFAARSPLFLIDHITAPVILFQGLEDRIVPPEQSARMADSLRARGIEVAYHAFRGEGHGFRMAETIIAVIEAELDFLRRVLFLR